MPIYDYRCLECGRVSEIIIRTNEQIPGCLDCGSNNLEQLISSSYMIKMGGQVSGLTCCGREDRCEAPPCSTGDSCRRY